ncbi:hypothetical protein Tco_0775723 [Tanacetum coccineum]
MHKPDQPQDHLSTPPRQQTPPASSPSPPSPPRSTQAPPAGHTSGGSEDLITLTVVSSVVSTLVQKENSLETELENNKKLFKDVVGKSVKKVKEMGGKTPSPHRKVRLDESDSDQEEGGEQITELKDTKKLFKDVVGKLVKKVKAYLKNRLTKPKSILKGLDLDADDKTFIKFVSDEDSTNEAPSLWFALAGWEVISTPLGEINALYRLDQSTKHFTTLREILHMVDRQDLLKLYDMVVTYFENHPVAGAGLMLWDSKLEAVYSFQCSCLGNCFWRGVVHFNKATQTANYMVLEGVLMKNKDVVSSRDIQLIYAEFSSIQVKTQAYWMLLQSSYFNPQGSRLKIYLETGNYIVNSSFGMIC